MFKTLKPLILASESPRRKRLLQSLGIEFRVEPSRIDESGPPAAGPAEAARQWAVLKASSIASLHPEPWILGADTIVVLDGHIFGKPRGWVDAASMLQRLSGRVHEVITGMCLVNAEAGFYRTGSVITRVHFKNLTFGEIEAYVRTGKPMDKAGAYGIQGIGAFLVKAVEGSYTNVVGLPLSETIEWLTEQNIIEPARE
ncbi:MAG: nucleoside triphosphate pyrophosphatase [Syntrophobacteraceae bacterium]